MSDAVEILKAMFVQGDPEIEEEIRIEGEKIEREQERYDEMHAKKQRRKDKK